MVLVKKGIDRKTEERIPAPLAEEPLSDQIKAPLPHPSQISQNQQASEAKSLKLLAEVVVMGLTFEEPEEKVKKPDAPTLKLVLEKLKPDSWSLPRIEIVPDTGEGLEEKALALVKPWTESQVRYLRQLKTSLCFGPDNQPLLIVTFLALAELKNDLNKETLFTWQLFQDHLSLSGSGGEWSLPLSKKPGVDGLILMWEPEVENHFPIQGAEAILLAALELRKSTAYCDLIFNLMPENFTLGHLQTVFELINGQKLLAPAFRKKIAPKVSPSGGFLREKKFRPSRLFRYNPASTV
jgi:hypothetical protein